MKHLLPTLVMQCLALAASAATFTVVNTNDAGLGSFRQAILDVNNDLSPDTIVFDVPGAGPRVIRLLSALPVVAQPVVIDGFTQPGARANLDAHGNSAVWMIELDGLMAGANRDGLELAAQATVRGLRIANFGGHGVVVRNDGASVAGCHILSNGLGGVRLDEVDSVVIGGTSPADRNVISGNLGSGVVLDDDCVSNRVVGNFIGTTPDGSQAQGNQGWGVHLSGPVSDSRVGGTNSGEANVIAFNGTGGVWVDFAFAANNTMRGNRIFSNGGLGIDLADLALLPGVSANDPGDADIGANQLQNYPVITNATINAATTTIQGVLSSQPGTIYALDFYGNMECDASGFGEGEHYLGSTTVTTDAGGNASFSVNFVTTSFWRRSFTATATDPSGNTSEFSPCWTVPTPGRTFTVVNTNDTGPGSLRQAFLDSGTNSDPNHIAFNIPGPGLHVIRPSSEFSLNLDGSTIIDGFTQPGASPNTLAGGNNANWRIEIDGSMIGGLRLSRNIAVRGLRIANGNEYGVHVREHCVVAGCFIYNNRLAGIDFDDDAEHVLIGGTAPADRNVISGNLGHGIVTDGSALLRVLGNWIGTDLTGSGRLGNRGDGILVRCGGWIGGVNPGEANIISYNDGTGVKVLAEEIQIRGNRIFANGSLDIDLLEFAGQDAVAGVSANDPGDVDVGANQLQNFPLITNVVFSSTATTIHGRLPSRSNTTYALDFYVNAEGHLTGHGAGERHLGSASVTTGADGADGFTVTIKVPLRGHYLTATATDPSGNTSEFSPSWPQPLRLELSPRPGPGQELTIGNANGSPIASERLAGLRVLSTTNLVPPTIWTPIPNALELTNGRVRVTALELTNGIHFFRSLEVQ